mgnify:CR=1 FL=1
MKTTKCRQLHTTYYREREIAAVNEIETENDWQHLAEPTMAQITLFNHHTRYIPCLRMQTCSQEMHQYCSGTCTMMKRMRLICKMRTQTKNL